MIELIVFLLFLNICAFIIMNRVLLNPINILGFGFFISSIALFFSRNIWLVNLSQKTVDLIIFSILFFCLGVLVPYGTFFLQKNFLNLNVPFNNNKKSINKFVYNSHLNAIIVFVIMFQSVLLILLYNQLKNFTGGGSLGTIIAYYRNTAMSVNASDVALTGWLNQGLRLGRAFSYVLVFVGLYRTIIEKKRFSLIYFFPILLYFLQSLLMGGRLELIRVFIFIVTISYFLYFYRSGSVEKANKLVIKASGAGIVFLPLFYVLKGFLGRSSTDGFVQYISRYLGGPIESFDLFLKSGVLGQHNVGQETFEGIYSFFSKYTMNNQMTTFRWIQSPNGIWVGNVYTGMRRYYADFGKIGCYLLMLLLGLIFGTFFVRILLRIVNKKMNYFELICYSFFIYSLLFQFFDDTFYSTALSIGTLAQLIEMFVFYKLIISEKS